MDLKHVVYNVYRCLALYRLGLDEKCFSEISRYENLVGAKPFEEMNEKDLARLDTVEKLLDVAIEMAVDRIDGGSVEVVARYRGSWRDIARELGIDEAVLRKLSIECHKRLRRLGVEHPQRGVAKVSDLRRGAKMLKHLFAYGYIVEEIRSSVPQEAAARTEIVGTALAYLGVFTYLEQLSLYLQAKNIDYSDRMEKMLEKLCTLAILLKNVAYEELPMLAIPAVAWYLLNTNVDRATRKVAASPSS